jgi:hypothetical protein
VSAQESLDQVRKAQAQMHVGEFLDVDGNQIGIGSFVHYVHERDSDDPEYLRVWNPKRWGIVTGLTRTPAFAPPGMTPPDEVDYSVRVQGVQVTTSRETGYGSGRDEFFCEPKSLRVLK